MYTLSQTQIERLMKGVSTRNCVTPLTFRISGSRDVSIGPLTRLLPTARLALSRARVFARGLNHGVHTDCGQMTFKSRVRSRANCQCGLLLQGQNSDD